MAYTIAYKPAFARKFRKLPHDIQKRLAPEIDKLKDNPRAAGTKKLHGFQNAYRFRVGDYRVIYEVFDAEQKIILSDCGHRSDIY